MEILEMILGNFLIWGIGAMLLGGSFLLFFIIRMEVSLHDSFVIWTIVIVEILWLIAVLIHIFFPEFYEMIANF